MDYYTISDVLQEVNKVVLKPDAESMRSSVTNHIQEVYQKLKLDTFKVRVTYVVNPTGNVIKLPKSVLKVEDVRFGGLSLRNRINDKGFNQCWPYYSPWNAFSRLAFTVDNNKIRLSEPMDQVVVVFTSLPVDENGELLVDSRVFNAVVAYCQGEMLMAKSANVKQDYATMGPALRYIQKAKELIDEARGEYAASTIGSVEDFYYSLQ